jgi:hypothetical protein
MRLTKIDVKKKKPLIAVLMAANGKEVIDFSVPPQNIVYERAANYNSVTPLGATQSYHQIVSSDSPVITMTGVVFGLGANYDIRPYLTVLDKWVANGTELIYKQGRTIDNLLLKSYNWTETGFYGGFPIQATAELRFLIQGDAVKPKITVANKFKPAEIDRIRKALSDKGIVNPLIDDTTGNIYLGGRLAYVGLKSSPFFKAVN